MEITHKRSKNVFVGNVQQAEAMISKTIFQIIQYSQLKSGQRIFQIKQSPRGQTNSSGSIIS